MQCGHKGALVVAAAVADFCRGSNERPCQLVGFAGASAFEPRASSSIVTSTPTLQGRPVCVLVAAPWATAGGSEVTSEQRQSRNKAQ